MSDEEWDSSWEYFSRLLEEANVRLEAAKEFIREELTTEEEKHGDYRWSFDFVNQRIVVFSPEEKYEYKPPVKKEEQYSDQLTRLYYGLRADKGENYDGEFLAKQSTFQVTEDCNMACTYCYQHNKKPNRMTFDIAKRYVDMLLDNDPKVNSYFDSEKMIGAVFEFIGGEPWLEIDLIDKISDYIISELFRRKHHWAIKFIFSICSNGLLHNTPKVEKYIDKHKSHLSYNITLDGNKELHDACRLDKCGNGTYDRALKSIISFRDKYKNTLPSKLTISPFNIPYLYDSIVNMLDIGYERINLNCVMEKGWEKHHATELYWQLCKIVDYLDHQGLLDKIYLSIFDEHQGVPASCMPEEDTNGCGGTGKMLALDWKGDFFPCLRYMENSVDNREPYIIGNVWDGINIKYQHKKRIEYLRTITRTSQNEQKCLECPINALCPSCNGYNYEYYGDPGKRTTFNCDTNKAQSLANYYYWHKRGENRPMYCPKDWAIDIIGENEYNRLLGMGVKE